MSSAKIRAIALTTFRELLRSRILYALLFFSGAILVAATFFGTVTIGDQVKVIKDFGLFSISLFSAAFSVISGTSLLQKELSRKTIFNILGKPVGRSEFLWGKFFGMALTTLLLISIMTPVLFLYVWPFEGKLDFGIIAAALCIYFEALILCGAALFFSSIVVTPALSGLFTASLFIAGRCSEYLLYFIDRGETNPVSTSIFTALYWIIPHLNMLNIGDSVVYGFVPGIRFFLWAVVYSIGYSVVLVCLGSVFFQKREFN